MDKVYEAIRARIDTYERKIKYETPTNADELRFAVEALEGVLLDLGYARNDTEYHLNMMEYYLDFLKKKIDELDYNKDKVSLPFVNSYRRNLLHHVGELRKATNDRPD